MTTPAQRLRLARLRAGYPSAAAFASAAGLTESSYRSHENGTRGLTPSAAALYAARLGNCSAAWLLTGEGAGPSGTEAAPSIAADMASPFLLRRSEAVPARAIPTHEAAARDLPVLGTAAASLSGAFQLALDTPIDFAYRPPMLSGAREAYGFYVVGDSMVPEFKDGDLGIAHPGRPVRIGDTVVVQVADQVEGGMLAYLKVLAKRDDRWIVLHQHNPPATIRLKTATVHAVHRVLRLGEILGV
jgi:phage repressor protein C with HTH and peptisase S24 domain